jgi:hypothetical protein
MSRWRPTVTTWFYVADPEGDVHRIPATTAERILDDQRAGDLPSAWVHAGGVVEILSVLLILETGRPRAVLGLGIIDQSVTDVQGAGDVRIDSGAIHSLAVDLVRRGRSDVGPEALAHFLADRFMPISEEMAARTGILTPYSAYGHLVNEALIRPFKGLMLEL